MSRFRARRALCAAAILLCTAGMAQASMLDVSISVGNRAASARFQVSGTNLIVTLTNTSTADVTEPVYVLTGVFFDITGPTVTLSRTSAVLAAGSTVIGAAQPAGGVVGGEWAYKSGLSGAPFGTHNGISSSGLGLFGPSDRFPGDNLSGPTDPDGLQYGITSAGDNPATHNGGADTELIKNSVVFTLAGVPEHFDPSTRIVNVAFQYGTALTEPSYLVPAPAASGLLAFGVLVARRRRR